MNRLIAVTIIGMLLAASIPGNAPCRPYGERLRSIGLQGGIGISNYRGDGVKTSDYVYTSSCGLHAAINIGGRVSFQPEILYIKKGSILYENNRIDWKLYYLEFPLLFKFLVQKRERGSISLLIGVAPAMLMSSKQSISTIKKFTGNPVPSYTINAKDLTKNNDLGLIFGFVVKPWEHLFFEPRFTSGVCSIDNRIGSHGIKNFAFSVLFGFTL